MKFILLFVGLGIFLSGHAYAQTNYYEDAEYNTWSHVGLDYANYTFEYINDANKEYKPNQHIKRNKVYLELFKGYHSFKYQFYFDTGNVGGIIDEQVCEDNNEHKCDVEFTGFGMGVVYNRRIPIIPDRVDLFFGAGPVFATLSKNGNVPNDDATTEDELKSETTRGFGYDAEIGINVRITDSVGLMISKTYTDDEAKGKYNIRNIEPEVSLKVYFISF